MIRYAVVAVIFMVSGCRQVNTKPSQKIENASQFNAFSAEKDDKNKAAVVYISKNKGTNWQPFSDGIPDEATVSCFIEKGNKIYAATEYHGVFINDGAKTWYSANNKLPKDIKIKALEYANDTLVLGSSNYGIWLSPDEGKTWQPTINEWIKTPVRCLFYHQNRLFSGTDNGIFVSFDNGLSWKKNFTTVQVNGFVAFQNNLYAGLANGAVMSNNSGATWRYIYTPNTLHDISHDAESVYALTLGEGLLKSNNNGATWQNVNSGLGNLYTFEVKNRGNDLFAAQWKGIFHSTNKGLNWTQLRGGLPDSTAFCTLIVSKFGILAGIGLRKP